MLNDLRYALRLIGRNKAFSATTIVTLAVGIGLSTSVFSVVDGVLFRPLPYASPSTLVTIRSASSGLAEEWHRRTTTLSGLAAFNFGYPPLLFQGVGASRLRQAGVSVDFFSVLGVPMAIGRDFSTDDTRQGAEPVVILTHEVWRQEFGGRTDVIGRLAPFEPVQRRVVGVLPAGFIFPMRALTAVGELRAFTPIADSMRDATPTLVGRLREGTTLAQARSEERLIRQAIGPLASQWPEPNVVPLSEEILGSSRAPLLLLLGAVGGLLLISCANAGNLVFVRGLDRSRELALRFALGARRSQVARMMIAESCVLSSAGGLIGVLMAWWSFEGLRALLPAQLPRGTGLAIDGRVLLFACVMSLTVGVTLGAVPAWRLSRVSLRREMSGQGAGGTPRGQTVRLGIVTAEVALAVVLLAAGALFMNSFVRLLRVDAGFDSDHVLTLEARPPQSLYPTTDDQRRFLETAVERLASLPGIQGVGAVDLLPVTRARAGGSVASLDAGAAERVDAEPRTVSPGYFETMGIPLLLGRLPTWNDSSSDPLITVINQALAGRLWPGLNPIGHRLQFGNQQPRTVVGVIGDVRGFAVDEPPEPQLYVPYSQSSSVPPRLVVRTVGLPETVAAAVRSELNALDPRVVIENVRPLAGVVTSSIAQPRFLSVLLGIFGTCGFLLTASGITGVVAYNVSKRTQEIGIRVALGAQPSDIRRTVIGSSLVVTGIGLAAGFVATLILTRFARSFLYEVAPNDPMTLGIVLLLLGGMAIVVAWLPARRAMRVDPVVALRAS